MSGPVPNKQSYHSNKLVAVVCLKVRLCIDKFSACYTLSSASKHPLLKKTKMFSWKFEHEQHVLFHNHGEISTICKYTWWWVFKWLLMTKQSCYCCLRSRNCLVGVRLTAQYSDKQATVTFGMSNIANILSIENKLMLAPAFAWVKYKLRMLMFKHWEKGLRCWFFLF